jgi:hypothetical protein
MLWFQDTFSADQEKVINDQTRVQRTLRERARLPHLLIWTQEIGIFKQLLVGTQSELNT